MSKLTQFEKDLSTPLMINSKKSNRGFWNLIVTKRDLSLFCLGMKPNRHWRLKDVKAYFGIKGSKEKCLGQITDMLNRYKLGEYDKYMKAEN